MPRSSRRSTKSKKPQIVVVAGPNGAGKTTLSTALLHVRFGGIEYVNADPIARGLSAFEPEKVAFEAGRAMLKRLQFLAKERRAFAFETTLASRSYARWIHDLKRHGYSFHILFLWLRKPELAILRVRERTRSGGHSVPEEVVRRRYWKGIRNFFDLYQGLADTWAIYDNTGVGNPILVASGKGQTTVRVFDSKSWERFQKERK